MDNVDPALVKAIEEGSYLVDPAAVADAIVRRHEELAEVRRLSAMLVAAQADDASVAGMQPGNGSAGADVA